MPGYLIFTNYYCVSSLPLPQVSFYQDTERSVCPLLRASSGPNSDLLCSALMPGYPTLATGSYGGEVWCWNTDSGALRRKLVPPGLKDLPENERPVERVAFMSGLFK